MSEYSPTERTRLRLYQDFGSYDTDMIHQIIDQAHFCHVSTIVNGTPYIQVTRHWRHENNVYMHGAVKNKIVHSIRNGAEACVSFCHFDGYILPRSAFNHAVLYRSVTLFSQGRFVDDLDEKLVLLEQSVEAVQPGRWATIRQPTIEELKMTGVIEFPISEVSAKALTREAAPLILPGGELEDPADADVSPWTGIIPYALVEGTSIPSDDIVA